MDPHTVFIKYSLRILIGFFFFAFFHMGDWEALFLGFFSIILSANARTIRDLIMREPSLLKATISATTTISSISPDTQTVTATTPATASTPDPSVSLAPTTPPKSYFSSSSATQTEQLLYSEESVRSMMSMAVQREKESCDRKFQYFKEGSELLKKQLRKQLKAAEDRCTKIKKANASLWSEKMEIIREKAAVDDELEAFRARNDNFADAQRELRVAKEGQKICRATGKEFTMKIVDLKKELKATRAEKASMENEHKSAIAKLEKGNSELKETVTGLNIKNDTLQKERGHLKTTSLLRIDKNCVVVSTSKKDTTMKSEGSATCRETKELRDRVKALKRENESLASEKSAISIKLRASEQRAESMKKNADLESKITAATATTITTQAATSRTCEKCTTVAT